MGGESQWQRHKEVWDHHVQAFGGRDVSMVCEDYDDGSVLIANGEVYKGPERIAQFFKDLFVELPKNCAFDLTNCIVLDKNVFIYVGGGKWLSCMRLRDRHVHDRRWKDCAPGQSSSSSGPKGSEGCSAKTPPE